MMKITFTACFFILLLGYGVKTNAQSVTLSVKNASLETVLQEIQRQSGYTIFYNDSLLQLSVRVTLDVRKADLPTILSQCFSQQPRLGYSVYGNTVVVKAKKAPPAKESALLPPEPGSTSFKLSGTVINTKMEPLGNANIVIQRTQRGAISAANGSFSLNDAGPGDTLKVSFVGYKDQEVPVKGRNTIKVILQDASNVLDEVVTQAYSKTSERFSTGNITTITAEQIERQPVMNPLLALQGLVPGLLVTQTNGFASAPVKMDIRGIGNLAQATDPLYIIDGTPLTVFAGNAQSQSYGFSQLAGGGTASVAGGESPLFSINPNDIESISVLTGADATAIYGSRGANGVILITTKTGKIGPTRFDINATEGTSAVTRSWSMLNTQQYLEMRREALKNDGITPTVTTAPDLLLWDTTSYTNWQKEMFGNIGRDIQLSAAISGGDPQTQFRINADYDRRTDITDLSGATQRATLAFNLRHTTPNNRFDITFNGNYAYSDFNLVPLPAGPAAVTSAPDAPPLFNQSGMPNWAQWDEGNLLSLYGTFAPLFTSTAEKTNFLTAGMGLHYKPITGLVISLQTGANFAYNVTNSFDPILAQNPYVTTTGSAIFSSTVNSGWQIEPQASYHKLLWKGSLNVNAGGTLNGGETTLSEQTGTGYTDDNLINSINNAAHVYAGDGSTQYKYGGLFSVINYILLDKYVIDLNGRRDGSTKFGPGKQYGNFGSIGAAWIISEEGWLKKLLPAAVNYIKFKGGIGSVGSDAGVSDYQYLSLWSATGQSTTALPAYGGVQPYQPIDPPNQVFHWASSTNIDAGVVVGLFKGDRVKLEARYYRNRTSDQITSNPIPDFTGFSSLVYNLPATIQNSGWEGIAHASVIKNRDFNWDVNFNISANRNDLVSFPGLANSPYAQIYTIGKPLGGTYVYHCLGVDPLTGQWAFADLNHDGLISGGGAAPQQNQPLDAYFKDLTPTYFGGFSTAFTYKHSLLLSLNFSFKKQIGMNAFSAGYDYGALNDNAPVEVFKDHWRQPGDHAAFPAFTTLSPQSQATFSLSDGAYTDASYLRLQNLSVAYILPGAWLRKVGFSACTIRMNAQNIFVITGYKGIDPETQNFGGMPPARIYTENIIFSF